MHPVFKQLVYVRIAALSNHKKSFHRPGDMGIKVVIQKSSSETDTWVVRHMEFLDIDNVRSGKRFCRDEAELIPRSET